MVIELGRGLTWLVVGVAVALVEPACVDVVPVYADLEQLATALAALLLCGFQQRRADPMPALMRDDIQLVEQSYGPFEPHVGPESQQGHPECRLASQKGDDAATGQQTLKARAQDRRPWRRRVVLTVESVQQISDYTGVGHAR